MLKKKILIVDDKQLNIQFLAQILMINGYQNIISALSGDEAIKNVDEMRPDLVLMDINLGGEMDGIDTARRIKEKHDIPIIYLTAHTDKTTIDRAKATAPDGYIIKPINELQLNVSIEMALHKHKLQLELKDSEERYRSIIRQSSDGIYIVDIENQTVVETNSAFQNILGYSEEELTKIPLYDFVVTADKKESLFRSLKLTKTVVVLEQKYRRKDGILIDVSANTTIIHLGNRELYCTIVRDITELKNILLELEKAQRLESLGTLAAGLAHNFNNLYQGVIGNLSLAKNSLKSSDEATKYLDKSLEVLPRVKDLTHQLITFSKGGVPLMRIASISDVLKNTADLLLNTTDITFKYLISDNLWKISFDESQISQVINNIVTNATQFFENNRNKPRIILISAENIYKSSIEYELSLKYDKYILIKITDNGCGIKNENMNKIFDPFFSTHIPERIGLGLTVAYSVIKRHNGIIRVESEERIGTTVSIYLPAAE